MRHAVILGLTALALADDIPRCAYDSEVVLTRLCGGVVPANKSQPLRVNVPPDVNKRPLMFIVHSEAQQVPTVPLKFRLSVPVTDSDAVVRYMWSEDGVASIPEFENVTSQAGDVIIDVIIEGEPNTPFVFVAYRALSRLTVTSKLINLFRVDERVQIPYPMIVNDGTGEETWPFLLQPTDVDGVLSATFTQATFLVNKQKFPVLVTAAYPADPFEAAPVNTDLEISNGNVLAMKLQGENFPEICNFIGTDNNYTCADGTKCLTSGCCVNHGNVARCPYSLPEACADPTGCDGQFCCSTSCARNTSAHPPMLLRSCMARAEVLIVDKPAKKESSGSSGISGGGIFLIIFFTLIGLYCGGGALYNYFQGKTRCPEIMPHHSFWVEVPSFVGEGCLFVQAKLCGRRSSKSPYSGSYAPAPRTSMGSTGEIQNSDNIYGTHES